MIACSDPGRQVEAEVADGGSVADSSPSGISHEGPRVIHAGGDGGAPPADVAVFDPVPHRVEIRLARAQTPAGYANRITCAVTDSLDSPVDGVETVIELHPPAGFEILDGAYVGHIARSYEVVCTVPEHGLRSETAEEWRVVPGEPARIDTRLGATRVEAGESVSVDCRIADAFDNSIVPASISAEIRVDPQPPERFESLPETIAITAAGDYDVRCAVARAAFDPGERLTVRATTPAEVSVGVEPEQRVYEFGQVLEVVAVVTDRYGNRHYTAPTTYDSSPALTPFGDRRFVADLEGRVRLDVRVDGETESGEPLTASREIIIDLGGPAITCGDPPFGGQIEANPGDLRDVSGTVEDPAGLQSVRVDGVEVERGDGGTWSVQREIAWGLNVTEITAVDTSGHENSTLCVYFAADRYLAEDATLDDAVVLRLAQGALDDGSPADPIRSFGDVIHRVVSSRGLVDTAHNSLSAMNPILPRECRQRILGICIFSLGVDYSGLDLRGPHDVTLTLVDGGLQVRAAVRGIDLRARISGTIDSNARVSADHVTVDMTFDVRRGAGGDPEVSLRRLNSVSVGDLSSDFSGFLTGAILELAFHLFESMIRDELTSVIRDFMTTNVDRVLGDLLRNVDLGSLAQGFDVPSLIGTESVRIAVAPALSRVDFDAGRAQIGVSTRVLGPARNPSRSLGVPMPPGSGPVELDGEVAAGVQLALINQVLHRLWRAGWFDAAGGGLVAAVGAELPEGLDIGLDLLRAPAVVGVARQSRLRLFAGPLRLVVRWPDVFGDPLELVASSTLRAAVRLVDGDALAFDGVDVERLDIGFEGVDASSESRQILADAVRRVLEGIMDRALNDAVPSLPIPSFPIPPSLGGLGLPVGSSLGLREPRLTGAEAHWILRGRFGE